MPRKNKIGHARASPLKKESSEASKAARCSIGASDRSKTSLSHQFDEQVRPYIDLVDSLRSLGLDEDINLPSVVVIGDQSTGKSSVLEAISGVQLPRGTGIVTRCALELRMKKMKLKATTEEASASAGEVPWRATLSYKVPEGNSVMQQLDKPEDVGKAVVDAQNDLAGEGKDIYTDGVILLEVQSPDVPDLTLIDLPGIARFASEGQAEDIEEQTKSLIRQHIEKSETIILCVIPCNADIATTEALKLAKGVDSEGIRTLGVMTKPDLVDRGTEQNIVEIAQNQSDFKLKLGFTVVKCRGQLDIVKHMTLKDAVAEEKKFFKGHEHFQRLYKDGKAGVDKLSKKLTQQLVSQIQRFLPDLLDLVTEMAKASNEDLKRLGQPVPEDKTHYLITLLQEFSEIVKEAGSGRYENSLTKQDKLYAIAHQLFTKFASEIEDHRPGNTSTPLYCQRIATKIAESRGQELPGFPSFEVFKQFAVQSVLLMKQPAINLLDRVFQKVQEIAFRLTDKHFERFRNLKVTVRGKIGEYLSQQKSKAQADIETHFKKERWIFTQDQTFRGLLELVKSTEPEAKTASEPAVPESPPKHTSYFDKGLAVVSSVVKTVVAAGTTAQSVSHEDEAKELLCKLQQYNDIVRARLCDLVPMTIYYYIITCFCDDVKTRLFKELTVRPAANQSSVPLLESSDESSSEDENNSQEDDWESPEELLREGAETEAKRKQLTSKLDRLRKAEKKLHKFSGNEKAIIEDLTEESVVEEAVASCD